MSLNKKGKVYLVGAGPGDPDLLTRKAERLIRQADIILYDRLVNPFILQLAKPGIKVINVGKQPYHKHIQQAEINRQLIDAASSHGCVVRLKGGDPAIFGRVREEVVALKAQNIDCEIVPGITAGIAAPAYAGIPVTHRDYSSSVAFVSGVINKDIDKDEYWKHLALGPETLCIYMGVKKLPKIVELLTQNGRDQKTPIALVHMGTSQLQKTVVGTLETIIDEAKEIENPAMIIVGEVVKLRNRISWFEATYKNELLTQLTYQ